MPRRTTGAVKRTQGLSLRKLMDAMTFEEQKAAIQVLRATDTHGPTEVNRHTVQALVNTFIVAAGGCGAKARLLLDQLATTIFADHTTGHVDTMIVNNMQPVLDAMKADSRPHEGQTARHVLLAACCPANKDPKVKGVKGAKGNNLARISTRVGASQATMYAAQERRMGWEQEETGIQNWLWDLQTGRGGERVKQNPHAVGKEGMQQIADAWMDPTISHASAGVKTTLGTQSSPSKCKGSPSKGSPIKRTVPVQFMNHPREETFDLLRALLPLRYKRGVYGQPGPAVIWSNHTLWKHRPREIREDKRLFSGLCRKHMQFHEYWAALMDFLATWPKCGDVACPFCVHGQRPPSWRQLMTNSVCLCTAPTNLVDVDHLACSFPKVECLGDCDACPPWLPMCDALLGSETPISYLKYETETTLTQGGKVYSYTAKNTATAPMHEFFDTLEAGRQHFWQHHFGHQWITKMVHALDRNLPPGLLMIRIDFLERFELFCQSQISEEEYHKQKLLLLVLTLGHVRSDGVRWDVATYISHANRMKKDWVSIMESICDAVGWARGRGGVSKVVLVSDRSPHEFSNSTTLRFIHDSLKLLCVLAEWVFDMEYHGKDVNDGIGAAMKKMLENWCATLKSIPTEDECLAFLWSHTKGKPINTTNHRKFKEYRFVLMKGDHAAPPLTPTVKGIKSFYHFRSGGEGVILRRKFPCFCSKCRVERYTDCQNIEWTGPWEVAKINVG